MMGRIYKWMAGTGCTGYTRASHSAWCCVILFQWIMFPSTGLWFGYSCWKHNIVDAMTSGFAALMSSHLATVFMMAASKGMTQESIYAKLEGRTDLDF